MKRSQSVSCTVAALALVLAGHQPGAAESAQSDFEVRLHEPAGQHTRPAKGARRAAGEGLVSVLVKFDAPSLAAYRGGVAGLLPTSPSITGAGRLDLESPRSRAYRAFLDQKFARFQRACHARVPGARMTHRLDVVFGGAALVVPESQLAALRELPGVAAVYRDELLQPDTASSPQFIGAERIWSKLGGQGSAGEGIVVGILDTGAWPELPSFSDPDPGGSPLPAPPASWTGTTCDFSGGANPGASFSCNNKLIGAHRFMASYDALIGLDPSEFTSVRDDDGHGTHTATTAAGNGGVGTSVVDGAPLAAPASGVAPRAHVAVYKVCGAQGCFGSDSAAAVQQAILDGVDVINFSISGGSQPYTNSVSLAFLDAYTAGVFVAAAAGNSGPGADTTDHREPWTTTVAASTNDSIFAGVLSLWSGADELELGGLSVTGAVLSETPVVLAADFGDALCLTPFPAGTFAGEIVACQRGAINRVDKSGNVAAGGAGGLILYNANPADTLNHDKHFLPSVHIDSDAGAALLAFMAAAGGPVTGTITQGELIAAVDFPGGPPSLSGGTAGGGDVMAGFSSRGGPGQVLGISKPDVAAPGVQILAGGTREPNTTGGASTLGAQGDYMFISGTSMASPHVAGSGALLKALHPDWSPWQIKSALMTTAEDEVVKEDGVTPADPFDYGSGRIDLNRAGDPGVTFAAPSEQDFLDHSDDLWNVNYPSLYIPVQPGKTTVQRTLRNEHRHWSFWLLKVTGDDDFDVRVPHFIVIPPEGERTIDIRVDARDVPIGEVRHATLDIKDFHHRARFPITIVRRHPATVLEKSCDPTALQRRERTECTISATNTSFEPATVEIEDRLPRQLRLVGGVTGGHAVSSRLIRFDGTLGPAAPPDVSVAPGLSPFGYFSLSSLGVPPVAGVGDETIVNFGLSSSFLYTGTSYTTIGMVSNGYAVVGGGSGADVDFINQIFPNASAPNNVLAPFWTDLNPASGGALRAATLSAGPLSWFVMDWEDVPNFSDPASANDFQIWIGLNGVEEISFVYGPDVTAGDGGFLTVGAENQFGNRGENFYADGAGTLPDSSTELVVTSAPGAPGETHTIEFTAEAVATGDWENCAEMTGDFFGTSLACVAGEVTRKKKDDDD